MILYSTCIPVCTNFLCASPDDKSIVWSTKPYQPTILNLSMGTYERRFRHTFFNKSSIFQQNRRFQGRSQGRVPGVPRETPSPTFKPSGLANAISSVSFIITLLTAMKCLSVLKPSSVKLQKRDLDVYEADMSRIEC